MIVTTEAFASAVIISTDFASGSFGAGSWAINGRASVSASRGVINFMMNLAGGLSSEWYDAKDERRVNSIQCCG